MAIRSPFASSEDGATVLCLCARGKDGGCHVRVGAEDAESGQDFLDRLRDRNSNHQSS